MPDPKPIPLGKPLPLSDAKLDALTDGRYLQETMQDVVAAFWRAHAQKMKTLLDAQVLEDQENDTAGNPNE